MSKPQILTSTSTNKGKGVKKYGVKVNNKIEYLTANTLTSKYAKLNNLANNSTTQRHYSNAKANVNKANPSNASNPNVANPSNPSNPNVANPSNASNPNVANPSNASNPNVANPSNPSNPNVANPSTTNTSSTTNLSSTTNASNPNVANPSTTNTSSTTNLSSTTNASNPNTSAANGSNAKVIVTPLDPASQSSSEQPKDYYTITERDGDKLCTMIYDTKEAAQKAQPNLPIVHIINTNRTYTKGPNSTNVAKGGRTRRNKKVQRKSKTQRKHKSKRK